MIYMTMNERRTAAHKDFSVAEAKAHFADCLRSAERGESVVITRHGRAVAAVVAAEDLERLERLRAAGPEGGLASIAGGWKGSEDVVEAIHRTKRSRPRRSPGR
jgi:prevent-host-death family protein